MPIRAMAAAISANDHIRVSLRSDNVRHLIVFICEIGVFFLFFTVKWRSFIFA